MESLFKIPWRHIQTPQSKQQDQSYFQKIQFKISESASFQRPKLKAYRRRLPELHIRSYENSGRLSEIEKAQKLKERFEQLPGNKTYKSYQNLMIYIRWH